MRKKYKYTDKQMLDFLQGLTDYARYTGKAILRYSATGRGWRLHETSKDAGVKDVREAIVNYMIDNEIE